MEDPLRDRAGRDAHPGRAVRANGEIKTVAGQSAELSTPVAGRIPMRADRVPHLGQPVRRGELLPALAPDHTVSGTTQAAVELEVSRARAELGLAERELKRTRSCSPPRRSRRSSSTPPGPRRQVAAARLAGRRAAAGAVPVSAGGRHRPAGRGGVRAAVAARRRHRLRRGDPGRGGRAGHPAADRGEHRPAVAGGEGLRDRRRRAQRVERPNAGASFTVAGFDQEFVIDGKNGRRVAVGAVVDRATRTVPIIFELVNPEGRLKPGMFAKVNVATGETASAGWRCPSRRVVDDNGRPVVFVHGRRRDLRQAGGAPGRPLGRLRAGRRRAEGRRARGQPGAPTRSSCRPATGAIPEHGHQH